MKRPSAACAAIVLSTLLSLQNANDAAAQNIGDMFGALIQIGIANQSWEALGPTMLACVNKQLEPQGESARSLGGRGIGANQPQVQPYVAQCQKIERLGAAWQKVDPPARSCVNQLLSSNSQSVKDLIEMGVGPSDAQVSPLFAQCQQVEAARKAWTLLDSNVKICVDRFLKNGGQSIDVLATQRVFPGDQQASNVMSRCAPISSQNLLKDVACPVENGQSRCDEFFVLEQRPNSPLNIDQLVTAMISGETIGKNQIEIPALKARRLAQIASRRKMVVAESALKKVAPLVDPGNTFAYGKAVALRKQIESARENPKATEADLIKLESAANALIAANNEEIERVRIRKAEMLARGEVEVAANGGGANQKAARAAVYYQVFEQQLRDMVGGQADGAIGQQFRQAANADPDKFRSDFFVSPVKEECRKAGKAFTCAVTGVFKSAVLKTEVQRLMTSALAGPEKQYRFILGYAETEDEATRFLIDNIRAEFVNSGYKVVARNAEEEARAKGDFDFYLNILDIAYDGGSSDVGSIGGAGGSVFENYALKARVKLLDIGKDGAAAQELANVPVLNTKRLPRDAHMPREARRNQLLPGQAKELARQIYREVSDRLLTITAPTASAAAVPVNGGAGQYSIKITGLSQRDREKIRGLRGVVTKVLSGTETNVDPNGTSDKAVEIRFQHADKFDPEDLVDAMYDMFKDKKTFKVRYEGSNSFVGSL